MKKKGILAILLFSILLFAYSFKNSKKIDHQELFARAIMDYKRNESKDYPEASKISLKLTFYGVEEEENYTKVYVYQNFDLEDSGKNNISGSSFPLVYYFVKTDGNYTVKSKKEPSDGAENFGSMQQLFPKKILKRMNSPFGFFYIKNTVILTEEI